MLNFNIFAVVVAAALSFVLGGFWYSPMLFLHPWTRANGPVVKGADGKHTPMVFAVSYVFALIACGTMAYLLGRDPPLGRAMQFAVLCGIGIVATSFGINYQFAARPWPMWCIDAGYHVAQFLIFGLVLGLWH
jgi:hypothetical protein